jgi:hypothetical protein
MADLVAVRSCILRIIKPREPRSIDVIAANQDRAKAALRQFEAGLTGSYMRVPRMPIR